MTIFILSSKPGYWYEELVGQFIENVWIGYTGHYHVYENFEGTKLLYIEKDDAIHK